MARFVFLPNNYRHPPGEPYSPTFSRRARPPLFRKQSQENTAPQTNPAILNKVIGPPINTTNPYPAAPEFAKLNFCGRKLPARATMPLECVIFASVSSG
jgi:hypothetical protein